MKKQSNPKTYSVRVNDSIRITENLFNYKKWFNGMKRFIAIRIR